MSSSKQRVCKDCGAPLPEDSAASTCTRCLLEACFEDSTVYGAPEAAAALSAGLAAPGEVFGDYELLEEIARGGMGVVFKARQRSLDRVVALKMMLPGWLSNRDTVRRFRVEAEAASRLMHPGIVAIHDVGECEGQHFYSMDYIDGRDLVRRVETGRVAPELAARWIRAVAEAIHHAHQHGILHRDLKPANVIIDAREQPHVTDFGLAKLLDEARDLTASGRVLGTPSFMPPEQADAARGGVTVASDVYGLGAILYFLLTGRAPFEGKTMQDTLRLLLTEDPVPPSRIRPGIPRDLETICLKCLGKEPQRRYASAAELADDLGAWSRHEPIRARPVSAAERLWFWARRNPGLAGVSMGLVAAIIIGAVLQQRALSEARRARAAAEGLVQYMNEDLTRQLRPLGRLALLDNVNRTVQRYYQGLPMKENPLDPRAGQIQFYQNNAVVLRESGRLGEAEASVRSAISLLEPLAQREPNRHAWAAALADAHAEMRNILAAQDPTAALEHAQDTVRFSSRAYELEPANPEAATRLANARLELASVLEQQKKTSQAAEEIRLAGELLAKLPAAGTNSLEVKRQLALAFYYQGLVDFDQGDKTRARASFTEYLNRTVALAGEAADPGDAQALYSQAVAHSHLGRALLGMKDQDEAVAHFREYHRLAEKLERLDPGNANFRLELGFSLDWLAAALEATAGSADEITDLLSRARECFQKLATDFPQGDLWQDHAARAVTRLAIWESSRGQIDDARRLLDEEVAYRWRALIQTSGHRANHDRFLRALGWADEVGGTPAPASDRAERLRSWLQRAAAEARAGAPRVWNRTLAQLHTRLAGALAELGQFEGARSEMEAALPLWSDVVAEHPNDPEAAVALARTFRGMTMATVAGGKMAQTVSALRSFVDWLKTRQPGSAGAEQVLQIAAELQGRLAPVAAKASPDERASIKEFEQALERMRSQRASAP